MGENMARREGAAVIGLAILALALRLIQLDEWSFWHDEALTVLLSRRTPTEIVAITAKDVHPPLYYLVVKVFARALVFAGPLEWAIRLPSALASAGAVVALYAHGRQLFGHSAGLAAALIMTVSPIQLFYAQEARMYAMLTLLLLLTTMALLRALEAGRMLDWALYIVGATAAAYTAYFIFPVLLAMGLYVVFQERKPPTVRRFLVSLSVIGLLYLPWIFALVGQAQAVAGSYWMERPNFLELLTTIASFFVGVTLTPTLFAAALAAVLLVLAVVLNSARHAWHADSQDKGALRWLLLWAAVPLILTFLVSLVRPVYQLRTVLAAAPAFYLLVGWGVTRAERRWINLVFLTPTLILVLAALVNFYADPAYAKPPWRQAAQSIAAQALPGDVIVHTSSGSYLPFLTYRQTVPQRWLPDDPEILSGNEPSQSIVEALGGRPQPMEQTVEGFDRVWLVVALDHAVEHQQAQKESFDRQYELLDSQSNGGIHVFLYATGKRE
jgi:mannosyltransferase